MAGSQLTQLKTALTSAGLNRKTASKKDKKAWKKGGARETDRNKTLAKLEDIRKNLNKFDQKETRVKHDVGGRNLKGVTGRPSASKQAGLEQRRKTLLPEHQLRGHTGTFRDRRFGESDPNMSLEDRMLERYTRERQRGQGRKGMFNLEDEDDLGLEGFDDGNALGALTHGGRNVSDLPGDDFMAQGLGDDEEDDELDEDEKRGRIDKRQVDRGHFGGFDDEELPEKKKSKAEVMSEIIAKSKDYKLERQKQKDMDDDLREELDDDLDGLRELLTAAPMADRNALPGPSRTKKPADAGDDKEYDQFVRTLAYEARAKPKDRTKTEDELAVEEAEELQKAEARRLRRMRGEELSDEEAEEGGGGYRKRRKLERRGDADDLDDDFEEDLLGPGITREDLENMGRARNGASPDGSGDEEEGGDASGSDDEDEDEDEEDGEEDVEEDDEDDGEDDEDEMSAMEDLDEAPELVPVDSDDDEQVVKRAKGKKSKTTKEIPYTFPCPANIEEFEDIMEDLDDSALPVVVQRIRAIHHPSLAQGNKEKLQEFLGVLIDYILILASRPEPAFDLISSVNSHVVALVKLNPVTASSHFITKITLMQRNLSRGLARGASRPESKTLPGCAELVLLRLVGLIWSTSDYSNPVVVPGVLLMGQYLAQSRIRNVRDLASGLFLCSLLSQYESLSKRLLPEAVNFVASSLLVLLPRRKDAAHVVYPEISDVDLRLTSPVTPTEPVDLARALTGDESDAVKSDLVTVALRLSQTFATMYASNEAFIEIIKPVLLVIEGSRLPKDSGLKSVHASVQEALRRMLGFAQTSRMPLAMQAHKPIPIRSFAPKFEDDFAPGKHYDPDAERNASNKLKSLYKKERKGAIRELRKDNRFLAGEKAKEQAEKDAAYTAKMRRVEGEIHVERAEEKEMQREKERQKRRGGRG